MEENKKCCCCCGGEKKNENASPEKNESAETEKKPMSADYARGTVGEGERKAESWTCKFCGMANTGAFCSGCGSTK